MFLPRSVGLAVPVCLPKSRITQMLINIFTIFKRWIKTGKNILGYSGPREHSEEAFWSALLEVCTV